jgi:hypothetical protein
LKTIYGPPRNKAWRNLMVAAINAGLDQRLFGLGPNENWWPGYVDERDGYTYYFNISGLTAIAYVRDIGWGELIFHVAVWPTAEAGRLIECGNIGFYQGECVASGWLERRTGRWLQASPTIKCRRGRLATISTLSVEPNGFSDRGRTMY